MITMVTARELADRIDASETFTLVDTRPSESYDAWHIRGAKNFPFEPTESMSDEQFDRAVELIETDRVFAICGKGISSTAFALELAERRNDHDFEVGVVQGGMQDWSKVYDVASVGVERADLAIYQIQRRAKGCLGYLVGSRETSEAVAVDVTRQTDVFKIAAAEAGATITGVVDTHIHADHISGGRALANELGVPYYLSGHLDGRDSTIGYDFEALTDGDTLSVGDVAIEALHAPGHTSEMLALRIDDAALVTSDTLFVDGVGRTELQFGDEGAARGAELLYDSVNDVIADQGDDLVVLPGHVTVTPDGEFEPGSPGETIAARLGDLREDLDAFTLEKAEFVEELAARDSEKPANYETIIELNTGSESVDDDREATELELGSNNCAA
ncbi:MBL fold metallo-hydrolase [Haloferacaceae archaeon DSL9]